MSFGTLTGKTAIITGAGRGIGADAAIVFAERGAAVVAVDQDESSALDTARRLARMGARAIAVVADVTSVDDMSRVVEQAMTAFGSLDCAFNNAGVGGRGATLLETSEQDMRLTMEVNVMGTWNAMRAQIPAMLESGGGSIVNASSGLGVVGAPRMSAYAASKHAVLGLTQSAALEFSAAGVRVNALLPGVIDTSMPRGFTGGDPVALQAMVDSHPIGRLGTGREVGEAAAWLCSDAASFVTGHGLAVDGGHLIR
ncbi:SDR family NAD(P)-dependent oxidoreductase [Microbacterium sp. BR1]|uniref:SDR family NAD(P)-dependent oxidoreductase n=1 Tax=Microbacterium sp. BR1 TaxID=1070896 RepID=UPI000C2BF0AF|nr:glucose 1-dehydrogenase [Microbacterium sp. BR1]